MHSTSALSQIIDGLNPDERAAFLRATYITLESCIESGDHVLLASIEDAEDAGDYRLHIGLPDRPDMRSAIVCLNLADAVETLSVIKRALPHAGLWLSTMQVFAEIEGDDVWLGVLAARASEEPDDDENPWVQLASDYAAGLVTHTTYGEGELHDEHWMYAVIARRIGRH